MRTAAFVLAVIAFGLLLVTFAFAGWWLWFSGPGWAPLAALVAMGGAACAGRWSDFLHDIAEERP